jgi:hypothetical protein
MGLLVPGHPLCTKLVRMLVLWQASTVLAAGTQLGHGHFDHN